MADAPTLRLTRAELTEIVGSPRKATQFAWCAANGIPVTPDATGAPVVLRAALEARLLPKGATRAPVRTEPDLAALPRRRTG
jgi:hypothetical protein